MGRPGAFEALDVGDMVTDARADLVVVRPGPCATPAFKRAHALCPAGRKLGGGEKDFRRFGH